MSNQDILETEPKTIGLVAPSFFIEKKKSFVEGLKYLKDCGFRVKFGDTIYKKVFNTTGTAFERAMDINRMFADSCVDFIITTDGGSRAIEVLEYLDYDLIKNNPKPICGFSDITHILLAVYSQTGNPSIHGIDLINGMGQKKSIIKDQNLKLFWNLIENKLTQMSYAQARILKKGVGTGIAIGGWLNAIHHLVGTAYFPKDRKIILFWEAVDEEPNRINMMLQSLRLCGLFERLAGMVVGKLTNCIEKEYFDCIPNIDDIVLDVCRGYNFPVIIDAPFGHGDEKSSFRLGTTVSINTEDMA